MLRNRLRLVVRPKKTIEPKNYTIANKTTKKKSSSLTVRKFNFYNEAKKRILSESARRTIELRYIRTDTKRTFERRQYANENFKLEASLPVNTFYRRYVVNILWKNSPRTTDKLPKPGTFLRRFSFLHEDFFGRRIDASRLRLTAVVVDDYTMSRPTALLSAY